MNQTEPSERTTTSLGLLSRLPSNESASTVIEPSCSVRVTRRLPCSQVTSRPCGSTVWPLRVAGRRAEDADRARRLVPAQHPVVRDVAPDEVAAGGEVGRALGPAAALEQLRRALGGAHAGHEAFVESLVGHPVADHSARRIINRRRVEDFPAVRLRGRHEGQGRDSRSAGARRRTGGRVRPRKGTAGTGRCGRSTTSSSSTRRTTRSTTSTGVGARRRHPRRRCARTRARSTRPARRTSACCRTTST